MAEDIHGEPNPEMRFRTYINREIRPVPLNWQHPQDEHGDYIPQTKYYDFEDIAFVGRTDEEAEEEYEEWKQYMMPDFSSIPREEMGICAYESFTEGTPISPVFSNTPQGRFELAKYCADNISIDGGNRANLVEWANVLFSNVPHTIDIQSGKIETDDQPNTTQPEN